MALTHDPTDVLDTIPAPGAGVEERRITRAVAARDAAATMRALFGEPFAAAVEAGNVDDDSLAATYRPVL